MLAAASAAGAAAAGAAAGAAAAAADPAFWMAWVIPGITIPFNRSIAWPMPNWLAALVRSPMMPPLAGAAGASGIPIEGSPRIG